MKRHRSASLAPHEHLGPFDKQARTMEFQHVAFKIFVDGELNTDWEQFINVFHDWVAAQSMPEMMIDVADYRHVPDGPGVVMVGREADYYMDNTDGRPGLRYVCKAKSDASNEEQVKQAFAAASSACVRLEKAISGLKFSRTEFEITINDRAYAPNTDDTRSSLQSELPSILSTVLGSDPQLDIQSDARKLAGASVRMAGPVEFVAA